MKRKQSEKVSARQKPEENSLFKLLKEEKSLFKQLLVFTIGPLIFKHCLRVRWTIAMLWSLAFLE